MQQQIERVQADAERDASALEAVLSSRSEEATAYVIESVTRI